MLIEFYGKECPHCLKIAPLVEELEKNLGVTIEQYEVWHNEDNLKKFREYDKVPCGGVPFFINTDTGQSICGETTYENLEKWAKGAAVAQNHSPVKNIDYSHILDGIYIGTNQCCQTHFDDELRQEGIEAAISLEEEHIDAPFGIKFYIWLPVKNHESPTDDQLDLGVSVLGKLIAMKKKVYVHCQNGHGRAPLLVAVYLVSTGKTQAEALSIITSGRPAAHLNELQMKSLTNFSNRCQNNS